MVIKLKQEYLNDCPDYLLSFLTDLTLIRDRAPRTEEAYYTDIRTFLRYLKVKNRLVDDSFPFSKITIADVDISYIQKFSLSDAYDYLGYLKNVRNNSTATRARKTSALKQFFTFLYKKAHLIDKDPLIDLELPRVKNKLPKFLSLDECKELLSNVNSSHQQRDFCILVLFLNCGMRLSELVGLNIRDYSRQNRTLRLFGKGRKERIVYLNNACVTALDDYLKVRPDVPSEPDAIFLSRNKKRIDKRRVQQIVEESLLQAGLANRGVSTHKLRHTAATLMYQHGNVDTLVLKNILGHKSIATTEIYTHLSDNQLKDAADSSPLSDVKNTNAPASFKSMKNDDDK